MNWLLAGGGNLVGAVVFVATSYWYLFLKDVPEPATPGTATQTTTEAPSGG